MATPNPRHSDLAGAWVRTLYRWWEHYDRDYLQQALRRPLIGLSEGVSRLGSWDPARRQITISRQHILDDPWARVLDTLRHEMAHQYVDEVLKVDETPHGSAFRDACRRLRCDPRATWQRDASHGQGSARQGDAGAGAGQRPEPMPDDRVIRLVKKLLSLADSPNEHEAQAAMSKAQRLLLEYNVDLVEGDGERDFERRTLGHVKGRHAAWELWLAMILNEFFFVEVLWARSYAAARDREGTVLEVYGTRTNLEMAEYVYGYLEQLLQRLWQDYRRRRSLPGNRERQRYFAGVVQGFHEKLQREQEATRASATVGAAGRSLVWKGDARLRDYYRWHNPHIVVRQSGGVAANEVYRHGVEEGRRVQLRRPVESGSAFGGYLAGRRQP